MKDTTAILNIAYKEFSNKIKTHTTQYKRYLSTIINSRAKQLHSNMPSEQIYFNSTDVDEYFKSTGIDKKLISSAISQTYYAGISNFNPRYAKDECTIAMLCGVRYFYKMKSQKDLELAMILLAFSGKFYPSIWYGSYPVAAPQEHVMEYVINNMCNNKFDIVREGNVFNAIKSICNTWLNTYKDRFNSFSDEDCTYLLQQLHNRIRSFMNNIAELYYEAYENKNLYLTYDSDDMSDDNYRLVDSDVFKLERSVNNAMKRFNTRGVDYKLCKMASNEYVKMNEVKSIIENISNDNRNIPLIKEYMTIMVALYFQESKTKDVRDLDFISYSIKAKPNSKNKYVLRHKELMNIILLNNNEHFNRRRNRKNTESAYYRSLNAYFALLIQESNK